MRAGRLDELITIQRKTSVRSPSGEPVETWATITGQIRTPASMKPVKGEERFNNPQIVAGEQIEFRVRYSSALADLNELDRIIHPALSADSSPEETGEERFIHDILAVNEIGRREGLQIIANRRPDIYVAG